MAYLKGETQSYHDDASFYETFIGEPYPYTKEEWERDVKGKSLFDLMPKQKYILVGKEQ